MGGFGGGRRPWASALGAASLLLGLGCSAGGNDGPTFGDTEGGAEGTAGMASGEEEGSPGEGSPGEEGGTTGSTQSTPEEALAQLVEARCGWIFGCCAAGEAGLAVGPFTADAADCVDRTMEALATGNPMPPAGTGPTDLFVLLAYSHAAGNLLLVDDAVQACATHLAEQSCNEPPPDEGEPPAAEHCSPDDSLQDDPCSLDRLVLGQLPEGAHCSPALGVECASGFACARTGKSEGTCIPASEVGDYCFSDDHCTSPLYCDLETGQCAKGGALGEPCAYEDPDRPVPGTESIRCAPGLVCDPVANVCVGQCALGAPCEIDTDCPVDHQCVVGRCSSPQGGGASCQVGADCESGVCKADSTCAPVGGNGTSCLVHSQCESGFCHAIDGVCSARKGAGEPCTSYSDVECQGGVCDNSDPANPVCKELAGPGDPCVSAQECDPELNLACIGQVCVSQPLPNGETCYAGTQCASGLCWESVCDDPGKQGDPCSETGAPGVKPCGTSLYCDGTDEGTCVPKLAAGQPCSTDEQCWGACTVSWGALRCDATPAKGEAICDGV